MCCIRGWRVVGLIVVAVLAAGAIAEAQDKAPEFTPRERELLQKIQWQEGPLSGKLGSVAAVDVPHGFQFIEAEGAKAFQELNGNPPSSDILGMVMPQDEKAEWFVIFTYDDIGYVKDDEKDQIDAKAVLDSIKAGTAEANKQRARMGSSPLNVVGWEQPPKYDTATNRLTWAIRGESEGHFIVNYNSRILGRGGVMSANLVVAPEALQQSMGDYSKLLAGFNYAPGQSHAEWKVGDKVAEYGLTALIAGGAVAVAAKSGLLGKLLKPLIVAGVAVLAALGKMWNWLFGRKSGDEASG